VNDRTTNEGWNDFNSLTLTSPDRQARPGCNSSKPFFGLSSSKKQTLRPRSGPHGLNSSKPFFSRPRAYEGRCTYYGGNNMCFQLHGYPKWWYELKGKKDE